jgi:phage terminase large subunit GpA-like protein
MKYSMTLSHKQKTELTKAVKRGCAVLETTEPLSASEWADRYFYLSAESSYVKGRWTTTPNQVAILNAMGNDDIEEVNWLKSARVGYTKCLAAVIGYFIEHKNRNIAAWQPDDGARDSFSKKHIDSAIRDVEPLKKLFPWLGKKHKNNTLDSKLFLNQHQVYLRGGKAAKNYREISVDVAIYDELSKFDRDIEHEGSPLFLGDKRLEGSVFRKSIRGSTPGVAGECQITEAASHAHIFLRRYVPCPHCETYQVLEFGGKDEPHGLTWNNLLSEQEQPKTVGYACRKCAGVFFYADYIDADHKGYWFDEDKNVKTIDGLEWTDSEGNDVDAPINVAFHLWSAYSHFSPWSRIVQDWIKAQKSVETLKSFVNTTLGEPWEDKGQKLDAENLQRKREAYPAELPVDVCILTAAVDVQDDRLEYQVKAWVAQEQSFNIRYEKLYGDLSRPEIWKQLHAHLRQTYKSPNGSLHNIRMSAIDTGGHFGDEVHKFCRTYGDMFVPIKGHSARGKPIYTWPKKKDKTLRTRLIMIGTDTAKDVVHARLTATILSDEQYAAGLIHWPSNEPYGSTFTQEYFTHLTNEERTTKVDRGKRVVVWDAKGKRNEPWDLEVYNLAMIRLLQGRYRLPLNTMIMPVAEEDEPNESEVGTATNVGTKNSKSKKSRVVPSHLIKKET